MHTQIHTPDVSFTNYLVLLQSFFCTFSETHQQINFNK